MLTVDQEIRSELSKRGDSTSLAPGEVLFKQGNPSKGIYLVIRGTVLTSLNGDGKPTLERKAEPGALLGVPATINGTAYSISAVAKSEVELIHISRPVLIELMRTHATVSLAIIDILSAEVREMRRAIKRSPAR